MTPVERLDAAITKLEELRVEGGPGPWRAVETELDAPSLEPGYLEDGVELVWHHGYGWEGTADLIVTWVEATARADFVDCALCGGTQPFASLIVSEL